MVFKKIDNFLEAFLRIITSTFLGITVFVTFLQVLFRYVIKSPLTWSQEVLMISFVYSVLFGAALIIKTNDHLVVDLFENAKGKFNLFLKVLDFVLVGTVIVALLYYGLQLVSNNLTSGQTLGFLGIQKAYVYMAVPISAMFMLYFQLKKVFS
ncbi:TRAP transporter small permease [Alkalibacillus aidingensis]|uniref:TRAP transporter small permease n=1 Tax=Alkalibacillus aidingensis TaxID=2747607 RepID=UPI0016611960|nr:TRAP transporter small permease subunit [Alkalibacillus aidingensis]